MAEHSSVNAKMPRKPSVSEVEEVACIGCHCHQGVKFTMTVAVAPLVE